MRINAPGLVAAAQRLLEAVVAVGGVEVGHPPLAADPASLGAAGRLTAAGSELAAGLAAHVAALVGTVEALTGTATAFVAMDEFNQTLLALTGGRASGPPVPGVWAPPAPPLPPDVRPPLPPPMAGPPEVISAAVHSGDPSAGEVFTSAWSQVQGAAHDAAATIRTTVGQLPYTLDAEVSTPAVSRHLLAFAEGFDNYAERARTLVAQATAYADNQMQARESIPSPQQLATADQNVRIMQANNIASGGRYAAPLAQAVANKTKLNNQAVAGYSQYHASTDAATEASDQGAQAPGKGDQAGKMAELIPAVLGAVGGMAGGLLGALAKAPEALIQAASQAASEAAQGMKGPGDEPKPSARPPDSNTGAGGTGGGAGGAGAGVSPAGGAGPLSVAPSTGSPSSPAVAPAGASGPPHALSSGPGGRGAMPMGMPMGGLGGAGQSGRGQAEPGKPKKIVGPDVPHTEDVTGRVDTNRLSAAAAATRARGPDDGDGDPPSNTEQMVRRRVVVRAPEEPA
jgi:hypothetical protein